MTTLHEQVSSRAGASGLQRAVGGALAAALAAFLLLGIAYGQPRGDVPLGEAPWTVARLVHLQSSEVTRTRLERSTVVWNGGPTTASTGETVNVFVSAALPVELGTPQTWADFMVGLLHGPELSSLTAYIAPLDEVQEICGEHTLGCYSPDRMVSMGETMHGVTAAEVVRHEYGHHIAFRRLNPPWTAIDWGPKNWATAQNICAREASGAVFPGDEGKHYRLNPGEGWAEVYRVLDERRAGVTGSGWQIVDSSFMPSETTLQAAERDVMQPWTAARIVRQQALLTARRKSVWRIPLVTPLDGAVEITVSLPRGGLHEVALVDPARNTVLATGLWASGTAKTLVANVCGQRSLSLRITRKGAVGRVRVVAKLP